jgi:replicative DNA helicase
MALADDGFATMSLRYVTPEMFESDALQWCWRQIQAERTAGRSPTLLVLRDKVRKIEGALQPRFFAMLDAVDQDILREDAYIKHALTEFVRRNLFVAAYDDSRRIYNMGKPDDAVALMQRETEKIQQVSFESPHRYSFYEDLDDRQRRRIHLSLHQYENTFPTGIDGVDAVLDGGLPRGELGCWMADSKGGKSLFLIHLAGFAARASGRRVLMVLLEGSYRQTANRLDAWHAQVAYRDAKRGQFEAGVFQQLRDEYRSMKDRLIIREMTSAWSYTAGDIRAELEELRGQKGWQPDMLVIDYGDLLRSQEKVRSEEEHQRNAFADLKTLTTHGPGYAIWTASQARRPPDPLPNRKKKGKGKTDDGEGETAEDETITKWGKPVLSPRHMSDSYNKVRRVDFLGSINQDAAEKADKKARLYCAIYRDNAADKLVTITQDLDKMIFVDLLDANNRPDAPAHVQADLVKKQKIAQAQPFVPSPWTPP